MLLVSEHDRGEPSEEPHTSLSVEKKHSRDDLFGGAGNASVQGTVSWNDVERGPQSMPIGPAGLAAGSWRARRLRRGRGYRRRRKYEGHYCCGGTGRHVWHESMTE